jgi:hypothetical protein
MMMSEVGEVLDVNEIELHSESTKKKLHLTFLLRVSSMHKCIQAKILHSVFCFVQIYPVLTDVIDQNLSINK